MKDHSLAGNIWRWDLSVGFSSFSLWLGLYIRSFVAINSHPSFAAQDVFSMQKIVPCFL